MDTYLIFSDLEFLLKFNNNSLKFLLAFTSRVQCSYEVYSQVENDVLCYGGYGVYLYPIGYEKFGYDECVIDVDQLGNVVYYGSAIPLRVERVILDVIRDYGLSIRVVPADLDLVISESHFQNRESEALKDVR